MSSIANTLVGSNMAMVSFAPAFEMGRMVYLRGASAGVVLFVRLAPLSAVHVGGDDLDHRLVDIDAVEGHRRHAEVLGEEVGELLLGDEPELHQVRAHAAPLFPPQTQHVLPP